jgi:hypothetical protein
MLPKQLPSNDCAYSGSLDRTSTETVVRAPLASGGGIEDFR